MVFCSPFYFHAVAESKGFVPPSGSVAQSLVPENGTHVASRRAIRHAPTLVQALVPPEAASRNR